MKIFFIIEIDCLWDVKSVRGGTGFVGIATMPIKALFFFSGWLARGEVCACKPHYEERSDP